MTVKQLFDEKYEKLLKTMTTREWELIQQNAKIKNLTIPQYMYLCLEITANDIKKCENYKDIYAELNEMHSKKEVASNKHRQEHGHVDRYWLTKKGLKKYSNLI